MASVLSSPDRDRRADEYVPSAYSLFFCWTVIAIVAATTMFIGLGGNTIGQWVEIAGYMFVYFYAWIPTSVSIFWLVRTLSRRNVARWKQVLIHVAWLATISVVLSIVTHPLTWQDWLYGHHAVGFHSLNGFIYSTSAICSLVIEHHAWVRRREDAARQAEQRQVVLEKALAESRMEALRAQINPHFLFNTLNSIASLVHSSSNDKAYKVVELLAALLRNALDVSRESVLTLGDELDFLDAYIEIEKVRYGSRLDFAVEVDYRCMELLVPALSLQPLVENVIKHAVAKSDQAVQIRVAADLVDDRMIVRVSDNGPGLKGPVHYGLGLNNVRDRVRYLFGDSADFGLAHNAEGGVTVTIEIPSLSSSVGDNIRGAPVGRGRVESDRCLA